MFTKRIIPILLTLTLLSACFPGNVPTQAPSSDEVATMVAATLQNLMTPVPAAETSVPPSAAAPTPTNQPAFSGTPIDFQNVHFVIPPGLAVSASGQVIPAVSSDAVFGATPEHIEITLTGYILPDTFLPPVIYIFPAGPYAADFQGAADSILRLQNLLASPSPVFSSDTLPHVPFFNAGAMFFAHASLIDFQNGHGVRILTQYDQFYSQASNYSMFYLFQGLTSDGADYIVVVLPASHPRLAATQDSLPPSGGIAYPGPANANADFDSYYQQVEALLNSAAPDDFTPTLSALDALVHSLRIDRP